jgi:lysozyme family protein
MRLGFWQAIWGTLISGGVAVAIPAAVDAYKAQLDLQKARQEVQLKQKEIESKAQDLHQTYISKFLDTALNQDIELRLRFSEYFSYVSEKESTEQWRKYHEELEKRRDAIRISINEKEMGAAKLSAVSKPSPEQQIELLQLRRELDWNYAEVGYARQDSNVTIPNLSSSVSRIDKTALSAENEQLFSQAIIDPSRMSELERTVDLIKANKARYQTVEAATGVPWFIVALVHFAETAGSFATHLHNGDPLSSRTVHVPIGRPAEGNPPFSWEDSAIDAVRLQGWQNEPGGFSTVGVLLFRLEGFDGYGYHSRNVRSPFIWACTNLYISGKYVADHVFDPNVKQKNCGLAALLKLLMQRQIAQLP